MNFIKKDKFVSILFPYSLIILVVVFSDVGFKKKIYNNLKFIIKIQDIKSANDEMNMKDNIGLFDVVEKIKGETKNQDCFFSFIDDAFLQIKLEKKPCTSKPFPQDIRTEHELNKAIDQLKKNKPNLILFDIDNFPEYYSLGLRVEDNIRSSIYSNTILKFILKNYSPHYSINGFHIWKINKEKNETRYVKVNMVNKELFFKSPKSICEMVKDESKSNCFVILLNKEKEIIDVVSGQINHSSISEVISLNQKHYFHKNIKKENELSLIPKDLNDINLYLKIENKDYLIKN